MKHHDQSGYSLIELMIAMVLGAFLIGGAATVFVQGSATQRLSQSISRVQENARFAINVVEPDVRLAGMYGRVNVPQTIEGRKGSATALGAITGDCATQGYSDLEVPIEGYNDDNPFASTCLPAADYLDGTDILVVRHAASDAVTTYDTARIYLRSDNSHGELFIGSAVPTTGFSTFYDDRPLGYHLYYVRPYSYSAGDGIPMLRRKLLSVSGSAAALLDEEVAAGVEDLQVQFGIDSDDDDSVDMYVDADSSAFDSDAVRTVRISILARAERAEDGFTDDGVYTYASKEYEPGDSFRRLLVSTTVVLRNRYLP